MKGDAFIMTTPNLDGSQKSKRTRLWNSHYPNGSQDGNIQRKIKKKTLM